MTPRSGEGTTSIYIGLGRSARITPGDLVGAIANETELVGRQIGPIRISDGFSVVGVPDWAADKVIAAMQRTTLKGKKATVRRYTDEPRPPRQDDGDRGYAGKGTGYAGKSSGYAGKGGGKGYGAKSSGGKSSGAQDRGGQDDRPGRGPRPSKGTYPRKPS
jgi:ATP-dependent RNA helicase DeaD